LIDKIIEIKEGSDPNSRVGSCSKAIKNVTINEDFFNGHFPNHPIMPGVLIIEAMAQTGGFACWRKDHVRENLIIASIEKAKFRRPVVPGDTLLLVGEVIKDRGKVVVLYCHAEVDGQVVAEAEIMGRIVAEDSGRVI